METESQGHIIGILPVWEKASWKTQQLITAITAAVISSLAVVAVGQVQLKLGATVGVSPVAALALGTAIAVGAVTFALQQMGINQFNRSRDSLITMFKALARDSENVKVQIGALKEWEEVAIAFEHMQEAIAIRVGEAQQKAAAAEKAKEELQQELIALVDRVEKDRSLALNTEVTAREVQAIEPPGTIGEFLDNFNQQPFGTELFIGSSTPEEIKQRKDKLKYRQIWLQVLLDHIQTELEHIQSNLGL